MQVSSASALSVEALSAPEFTVEVVSREESFLALGPIWNRLVDESAIDHPFLSHEWTLAWWQAFGAGKELRVLVVKLGAKVVAIAPLMLTRGRLYGLKFRKLEFLSNVHSPRCDFIIAHYPDEAYEALRKWLAGHRKQWDVLQLCHLPSSSRTLEELPRMAAAGRFLTGTWHSEDSPYVEFGDGWSAYSKRLSSHHRSQMRYDLKKLGRLGAVELELVSRNDITDALQDGFRIEAAAWKAKAGTAILCRRDLLQFYTRIAEEFGRLGILHLMFLKLGGKRIAFAYGLCYKNKLYVLKTGYQPEYAPYSPYQLLCYLLFQDACERAIDEYEFLGSDTSWKRHWTKKTKPHDWLYVLPMRFRTLIVHSVKFRVIRTLQRHPLYISARNVGLNMRSRVSSFLWNLKPRLFRHG